MGKTAAVLLLALLLPASVQAEDAGVLCDRLAAEPGAVPDVAGVALEAIDADAAIAACAAALEQQPAEARFAHQYARALERAGRLDEALRLYAWAAEDGYVPAQTALQRLAAASEASGQSSYPHQELETAAQLLSGLAAVLSRYGASLPADPADPLTLLADVGSDPQALLRWVSDNTRLVAYRGTLRGASGVLLDRAGNSLDRALLLATLLRHAGQQVRLARTQLSDEQARALLPATERSVAVPSLQLVASEAIHALFASDPRLADALVRRAVEAAGDERRRIAALFAERQAILLPALQQAIGDLAPAADREAEAVALAALADHFWVQRRTAAGWQDLDPDGPLLGTLAPAETLDVLAVPTELRHSVVLRVILELTTQEGRRETTLLEWQGYPAELLDRQVSLRHVPRHLGTLDLDRLLTLPDGRERLLAALDEEQGWMPLLLIGDESHVDKLFTRDGAVALADVALFSETGRALGDLFNEADSLLSGGEASAREPAVPSAEWLEIEVRVPGAPPLRERRTLFDLIGPAARAAGATATITEAQLRERALRLLGQTEIVIVGAMPSALQVARLASRELAALAERLRGVLAASGPFDLEAVPSRQLPALALYDLLSQRFAGLGSDWQAAAASPTVVLQHQQLSLTADLTALLQLEVDIVRNEVSTSRSSFQGRLAQGVADTVLEGLAFGALPADRNAAALHAADLADGRTWSLLQPDELSRLAVPGVPPDYRARLEADLQAGLLVIAPDDVAAAAAAGRLAWWRIDPRTGTTLGLLPDGAGAALTDYALLVVNHVASVGCVFFALGHIAGGWGDAQSVAGLALCAAAQGAGGFVLNGALGGSALLVGSGISVAAVAVFILQSLL